MTTLTPLVHTNPVTAMDQGGEMATVTSVVHTHPVMDTSQEGIVIVTIVGDTNPVPDVDRGRIPNLIPVGMMLSVLGLIL